MEELTSVQLVYRKKSVTEPVCRVVDTIGTTSHIYEAKLTTGKSDTIVQSTAVPENSCTGAKAKPKPKFKTMDFGFLPGFLKPKDDDNVPVSPETTKPDQPPKSPKSPKAEKKDRNKHGKRNKKGRSSFKKGSEKN